MESYNVDSEEGAKKLKNAIELLKLKWVEIKKEDFD